jgi:predicted secreted protein
LPPLLLSVSLLLFFAVWWRFLFFTESAAIRAASETEAPETAA